MKSKAMLDFVGKYVQVYPSDTLCKYGTIVDINEGGVIFKIDGARSKAYHWKQNDGKNIFIAYSARLDFVETEKQD